LCACSASLNAANNKLQGTVPDSIGNLTALGYGSWRLFTSHVATSELLALALVLVVVTHSTLSVSLQLR
jgi:hypothetical protein